MPINTCKFYKSGSSRRVYLNSEEGFVIKVAINDAGYEQNLEEIRLSELGEYNFLCEVIEYASDKSWLKMPFGRKMLVEDFKLKYDFSFRDFRRSVLFLEGKDFLPSNFGKIEASNIYQQMKSFIYDENHSSVEIMRKNAWKVVDDSIVIVDYGANWKTLKKYY